MSDNHELPATLEDMSRGPTMSPALQIMLNEGLFNRCKEIAKFMSMAKGFLPDHLVDNQGACFAVVTRSIVWKLDPYAVGQSTYSPAPGKIGYEGKLCIAILEASGKLEGGVRFDFYGDWSKIQGKFKKQTSAKGREYAVPAWNEKDEQGVGVTVSAQIRGEATPRTLNFDLLQAFPRNSTLWATDPKTQICYTAGRRFGSLTTPLLFMGVPFDREEFTDMQSMGTLRSDGKGGYTVDDSAMPDRPTRASATAAAAQAKEIRDSEIRAAGGIPDDEPEVDESEERQNLSPQPDSAETTSTQDATQEQPTQDPEPEPDPKENAIFVGATGAIIEKVKKTGSVKALNNLVGVVEKQNIEALPAEYREQVEKAIEDKRAWFARP